MRTRAPRIRAALETLVHVDRTGVMPIHGDLHVGQVLRSSAGYYVNDFDGNPILDPADRGRPQPPARDVAGMLQSLDHVGRVVLRRVDGVDPRRIVDWIPKAQDAFLAVYRERLAAGGCRQLLDDRLLVAFRVEQELRELQYAELHLPRWRYVPDAALSSMFP